MSLKSLIEKCSRLIILYPIYLGISQHLESTYPSVKVVRLNPHVYNSGYVKLSQVNLSLKDPDEGLSPVQSTSFSGITSFKSENTSEGFPKSQFLEVLSQYDGKSSELIILLMREPFWCWPIYKRDYLSYTFVEMEDLPLELKDNSVQKLNELNL